MPPSFTLFSDVVIVIKIIVDKILTFYIAPRFNESLEFSDVLRGGHRKGTLA